MKKIYSLLLAFSLVLAVLPVLAQTMGAYVNYRDRLIVFDDGVFKEIEYQKPHAVKVGGNYVAYLDNTDNLKVYQNGQVKTLEGSRNIDPTVTNYFLGYKVAGALKVYHDGKLTPLCYNTGAHIVQDSIVAWFDEVNMTLNIYENGETIILEDALALDPINNFKAGDNILAYITNVERKFKIYYDGGVWIINDFVPKDMEYKVGRDLVAYQDVSDKTFKAFYKGETYDIENFMPKRFEVGDEILAYVDVADNLKVFEGGQIYTAAEFAPDKIFVQDSLVMFEQQGFLWAFKDGKTHQVTRYIPKQWRASWGTIAFLDQNGFIRVFQDGEENMLSRDETVNEFDVNRNVIVFKVGVNTNKVWYKGRLYQNE